MTYKIVFLDIDGTILKPDGTYNPSVKSAVSQLQQQGIHVFLATGRPLHDITELASDLGIHSMIGYNGAYAIYQDQPIIDKPMKSDMIEHFLHTATERGQDMVLYTKDHNYYTALDSPVVTRFIDTFHLEKNQLVWPHPEVTEQTLGGTFINMTPDEAIYYERDIDTDLELLRTNVEGIGHCYDFVRTTVNKGEAVKHVLQLLDIPHEDAIAFGDGLNDKEMLQTVGAGFAMENADPNLFQFVKRTTTSAENDGIYNGLVELGLVKDKI